MAGENFTEVDAFFASVAFRFQTYGLAAMQEWYSAGLKEVWRKSDHEQKIQAAGIQLGVVAPSSAFMNAVKVSKNRE